MGSPTLRSKLLVTSLSTGNRFRLAAKNWEIVKIHPVAWIRHFSTAYDHSVVFWILLVTLSSEPPTYILNHRMF